jgi:hypothetical protein
VIKHALIAMLLAGGATQAPGIRLQDEGVPQGRGEIANCIGTGITCTRTGETLNFIVNTALLPDGGSSGGGLATETKEYWPVPEDIGDSKALRVMQTTFEGASLVVSRPVQFDRILFWVTNQSAGGGSPTVKILLYQAPDGVSGPTATRVATVTAFPVGGTGAFLATPAEGTVTIQAGLLYLLFGRDSAGGSVTIRTFSNKAMDLLTANVNLDTHPTVYTTGISTALTPATIDTRQSPTGQLIGQSVNSLAAVIRLLNL